MLFAVNLFTVSEHRDLLALWMFTTLFGVWYHVILFMLSATSWRISWYPVCWSCVPSRFLTAFICCIDMLWALVSRAKYGVFRRRCSVCRVCITPKFLTTF